MPWFFTVAVFFLSLVGCSKTPNLAVQSAAHPKPTSVIPDRREFPVSASVLPCTNFYEYACSEAIAGYELPENRSRHIFAFNDSFERILAKKKSFLAGLAARTDLSPRTQQLKDNYAACLNTSARANEEKAAVEAAVKKVTSLSERAEFNAFLASEILSANGSFVALDSDANLNDPSQYDILFQPTLLGLPVKEYYEDEALMADYLTLVKQFFTTIGSSNADQEAAQVVNFEKAFAASWPLKKEMHGRQADKKRYTTREALLAAYPNLQLGDVLAKTPETTRIRNFFPESMAFVNEALENESLDTLKSVYLYHVLSSDLMEGYPAYFAAKIAFKHHRLGGPPKLADRAERCTQEVMKNFDKEIDAELVDVLFPGFPKAHFNRIADLVRKAIIRTLEGNTWLTKAGKAGALRKMRKARMQLVSPNSEEEWDWVPVAAYQSDAPLSNQKLRKAKIIDKTLTDLTKARDWQRWAMGPLTVNAYYEPSDNKFVMLMGILQYPFYDPKASDVANLGAVGVVVGHELGHGFDNNGSRFNENGVLEAWMPEEDLSEFQKRTKLLVDQFNAYVPASINPKYGELTLGENIADTSGLKFSYEAAFPGNVGSIADKKLFYLQYARAWCGTMREKELENRWRDDYHAQTEKRVNGPLMHQRGFYEAYSCNAKNAMYLPPAKRMDLW